MNRVPSAKRLLLFILAGTIIGGLAANPIVLLASSLQPHVWQSMPSPDSGAAKIITFSDRDLIVRGRDDLLYACNTNEDSCRKIEPEKALAARNSCDRTHLDIPAPPNDVIETAEFHLCGDDSFRQHNVAILANGHLAKWDAYYSAYDDYYLRIAQGFLCCFGGGVGAFLSIAVCLVALIVSGLKH